MLNIGSGRHPWDFTVFAHAALAATHLWRPSGLLVAFPVMAYGFTAHPYYLGIYNNLQTGSFKRMTRVTDVVRVIRSPAFIDVHQGQIPTFICPGHMLLRASLLAGGHVWVSDL